MTVKATAMPIPSGVELGRHGLLIHNQIGHHPFNSSNPLLQFSLLSFQSIPLGQCQSPAKHGG